ncbi:hypothetical protein D1610_04865 [Sphingomonas gilva]|uniref:Uncharacterized protein n=1 Tax=Sphingomonas gilva TaxID=2305907 RepID=A0A396RR78_9SPHN|nr:hypothetical protein D1610_04865 [Sphingomonas gilva]
MAAQITLTITEARERPWASATFHGARHVLSVGVAGDVATIEGWLAALPEHPFAMAHHIVADIAVVRSANADVVIEALTVAND